MDTAQAIYELVRAMPEEQANLVLQFTQFVQQQGDISSRLQDTSTTDPDASPVDTEVPSHSTREERLALSKVARGRFAHLPNSSEAFAQRKQAEIDWEDRNR